MLRVLWLVGLNFNQESCSAPTYINEFVSTLNFHIGKINKHGNNYSLSAIYSNNYELENKYIYI